MRHLFCFGLGYSAGRIAEKLRQEGWQVSGTSRDQNSCDQLIREGFEIVQFDGRNPILRFEPLFQGVTHLLLSVPPDAEGDPVLRLHGNHIASMAANLKWVGYLSTTGVYGDRQAGWVDETSKLQPTTTRGYRRVAAEKGWCDLHESAALGLHIFRLAGIYGPGRNQLVSLRKGKARSIVKPGQVFSRIHVDDLARIVLASMAAPNPGRIYNVCDDEAAPPQEVVGFAAKLLDMQPPPEIAFEDAELSPMGRSFYAESKRVDNRRIKDELGVTLGYPTYREGLTALLDTLS